MARERVVGYLDSELYPEWQEIVTRRGGESAAVGWVIYEEILRKRGHATKDDKLDTLLAEQAELRKEIANLRGLIELLQAERWSQMAPPDGRIRVEFIMDDAQLERVLKARG